MSHQGASDTNTTTNVFTPNAALSAEDLKQRKEAKRLVKERRRVAREETRERNILAQQQNKKLSKQSGPVQALRDPNFGTQAEKATQAWVQTPEAQELGVVQALQQTQEVEDEAEGDIGGSNLGPHDPDHARAAAVAEATAIVTRFLDFSEYRDHQEACLREGDALLANMSVGKQTVDMLTSHATWGYARRKMRKRALLLFDALRRCRNCEERGTEPESSFSIYTEVWHRLPHCRRACSVGGGPGSDLFGVWLLLRHCFGVSPVALVSMDFAAEAWQSTFHRLRTVIDDMANIHQPMTQTQTQNMIRVRTRRRAGEKAGTRTGSPTDDRIHEDRQNAGGPTAGAVSSDHEDAGIIRTAIEASEKNSAGADIARGAAEDQPGACQRASPVISERACREELIAMHCVHADVSLALSHPMNAEAEAHLGGGLEGVGIICFSYILTETRGQWHSFFLEVWEKAREGTIFYFAEPTAWQCHVVIGLFPQWTRGVDFGWIDDTMHASLEVQASQKRSTGPAILLAIKRGPAT